MIKAREHGEGISGEERLLQLAEFGDEGDIGAEHDGGHALFNAQLFYLHQSILYKPPLVAQSRWRHTCIPSLSNSIEITRLWI